MYKHCDVKIKCHPPYDPLLHLWMRWCHIPQNRRFTRNIPHLSVINSWMWKEDPRAQITLNRSASFCIWEVCNWFCAALYLSLSQKAVDREREVIRLNGYCQISVRYPTEEQCLVCLNQLETHWLVNKRHSQVSFLL